MDLTRLIILTFAETNSDLELSKFNLGFLRVIVFAIYSDEWNKLDRTVRMRMAYGKSRVPEALNENPRLPLGSA